MRLRLRAMPCSSRGVPPNASLAILMMEDGSFSMKSGGRDEHLRAGERRERKEKLEERREWQGEGGGSRLTP